MPSQPNLAPEDRFRRTVEETLSLHDQLLLFAACRATKSARTKTVQPYQVLGEYLLITRGARIPSLQDILSHIPVLETGGVSFSFISDGADQGLSGRSLREQNG